MLDYLRPGDQFIDIGANIGLYTLLARSIVGQTGYIHAFEPNREIADRLQETLDLNDIENATVHVVAVSDVTGEFPFDLTGDNCTAHISYQTNASPGSIVSTIRLDDYLPSVPYAMAKLDIEGYEPFSLRGASTWLNSGNPPVLQIEMAGYSKWYGITTPEFIAELDQLGYFTAVYIPDKRTIERTDRPWEVPVDNVLAISRNKEQFVLERLS